MKKALVIYANGSEDLEVTAIADVLARGQVEVTKAALTASGVEVKLSHGPPYFAIKIFTTARIAMMLSPSPEVCLVLLTAAIARS